MRKHRNAAQTQSAPDAYYPAAVLLLCLFVFVSRKNAKLNALYRIQEDSGNFEKYFFHKDCSLIFISKRRIIHLENTLACVNWTPENYREFASALRYRRIYEIAIALGCCFNQYGGGSRLNEYKV